MAIRIITDSAADYSAQEIEKRQITCIPMTVTFGDREYLDGHDITKEGFFRLLMEGKDFPKTSQPSPSSFLQCFKEAKEAGDAVKFDQVLAVIDGDKATFGTPTVAGASVEATVVKNGKGKKIRIFKYNP